MFLISIILIDYIYMFICTNIQSKATGFSETELKIDINIMSESALQERVECIEGHTQLAVSTMLKTF